MEERIDVFSFLLNASVRTEDHDLEVVFARYRFNAMDDLIEKRVLQSGDDDADNGLQVAAQTARHNVWRIVQYVCGRIRFLRSSLTG